MSVDERLRGCQEQVQALLGYLNFAEGRPDPRFQKQLHDVYAFLKKTGSTEPWKDLATLLRNCLGELRERGSAAFTDSSQVEAVINLVFSEVLPAYRAHHCDLLAHQSDEELWQPFFLARACEATLNQRGPWTESARIVKGSLRQLNDYVGHRPVATLENHQRGEIYEHERVRPIPLFIRGPGVAEGKYHDLVARALEILATTSDSVRAEAYFDVALMDELAYDPRAYDFNHPADKRPNYSFGEWDPHHLDQQAHYRRFIVRQILLDGLCERVQDSPLDHDEVLFEAAAVLAGTMLMGSGISGSGPQVHDSTTTLSILVPRIARYREAYYAELLARVTGKHGTRLQQEAKLLKQPFGGARQALNQFFAKQRALQLQQRHLALLFAQIGYVSSARRQTSRISVTSARLLTEMQIQLTTGHLAIDQGRLADAGKNVAGIEDLLKRGIACGALVDPWNILGFQAQFPRFQSLEDSVRDSRIDDLIHMIDQFFDLYGRLLSEGASSGTFTPDRDLATEMRRLADWWDRFASVGVSDIQHVRGQEATQSAEHVARSLHRWKQRGAAAADLAFWREQLEGFYSPKGFARVVDALLHKRDFRSASALLVTWLGHVEQIPLVEGDHSFHQLALRWMMGVNLDSQNHPDTGETNATDMIIKFFDFVEANADEYWQVPRLDVLGVEDEQAAPNAADDEDESLYGAAYEEMTYKDSTDDNIEGEVIDAMPQKDFDLMAEAERLETRLQFLSTLARLWNIATRSLIRPGVAESERVQAAISHWIQRARHNERELRALLDKIHGHEVPKPSGTFDALVEFDRRRTTKERLLNQVIATCLDHALAIGALRSFGAEEYEPAAKAWEPLIVRMEHALLQKDTSSARLILPEFNTEFREEPLLYTPLSHDGDPQLILRASLAQTILRGLVHNLPKQGMLRETYQLLRLARRMEASQNLQTSPRMTEFDRLFQIGLQAVAQSVVEAALRDKVELVSLVEALEKVIEPFAVTWRDHSQTLRISSLEQIKDRDWMKLTSFIKRYGRELFHARFLAPANLRAIVARGVNAYLKDLEAEPDPLHPLQLVEDLGSVLPRAEAEQSLQLILQTLLENSDHLRDYNATTTQSDYGENLHRLFDFLRLKAGYERVSWLLRPQYLAHDVLARHDGQAAARWRERIAAANRQAADKFLHDLSQLERTHGIRLTTIRERLEERFVEPMVLDRLAALLASAVQDAKRNSECPDPPLLERELQPFADKPTGVGLDVPDWLLRLETELQRLRTSQSDLANLAETIFHVPWSESPFTGLVEQLRDWNERTTQEDD